MARNHAVRNRLDALWDALNAASSEGEQIPTEFLDVNYIQRVDFNFEAFSNAQENLSLSPPFLFHPLPLRGLQSAPIAGARQKFPEYCSSSEDTLHWSYNKCTAAMAEYTLSSALRPRPSLNYLDFAIARGLNLVQSPDPLTLRDGFPASRVYRGSSWNTDLILEADRQDGRRVQPQTILLASHTCLGSDRAISFGELFVLLTAMRNRANQPRVLPGEEEGLADKDEARLRQYSLKFPHEEMFPVLMISYVGPQRARLFYACMDGHTLVIRQSRLYSFERESTAPVDPFVCLLLSKPLTAA